MSIKVIDTLTGETVYETTITSGNPMGRCKRFIKRQSYTVVGKKDEESAWVIYVK